MIASVRSMRVPAAQLGRHHDDAFIGLRRELGVEKREHQHGRDHRQHADADDDWPVDE
jgi:hypothetical protein